MKVSLAVAATLILLYSAFIAYALPSREARFQAGDHANRHAIEKFADAAASVQAVLVGSSLTGRLGTLASPCAYNLALAGESASTGLETIARVGAHPRVVLVETNVAERKLNSQLVTTGLRPWHRWIPVLATENMPVNRLFSYLAQYRPGSAGPAPGSPQWRRALSDEQANYRREIDAALLTANIASLRQQVRTLEARGVRVEFFELPVHPSLRDTPLARQVRNAFTSAFPDHRMIDSESLRGDLNIQTLDGIHLAPGEVEMIRDRLEQAYAGQCPRADRAAPARG